MVCIQLFGGPRTGRILDAILTSRLQCSISTWRCILNGDSDPVFFDTLDIFKVKETLITGLVETMIFSNQK